MSERRYDQEEVAEIFRTASEGVPPLRQSVSEQTGLTLADLQSIGREVGIAPDAVAHAAIAIDVRQTAAQRKFLGIPIGVSRTVDLHRTLTDDDWERLVGQLRVVFNATGRVRAEGSFRRWSNGNLQVTLEPAAGGQRLSFRTVNSAAQSYIGMGVVALGAAAVTAISVGLSGDIAQASAGIGILGLVGAGLIGSTALRLPRWARLRAQQMETLATTVALPPRSDATLLPPSAE